MRPKNFKKMTKKHSQYIHFDNACITRLGHRLDQNIIIKQIRNNELEFIDRQSHRVSRWKYLVDNKEYMICYDTARKQLITIIPYKDNMEDNKENTYYWWIADM